jgi:predicted acyl esterase
MVERHPFFDEYWESKKADLARIEVPAYIASSYTTTLHVRGGHDALRHLDPKTSWLRIHNTHEWMDLYQYETDLLKFFDATLKQIDNDWYDTPRVRLSVLDPGHEDTVNRPEADWPLPDLVPTSFYLDAASGALRREPQQVSSLSYDAVSGVATFSYTAQETMEIVGPSKLRLWVEAEGSNDLDLYIFIQKLAPDGSVLLSESLPNVFVPVALGQLRASHRELDVSHSTDLEPVQTHAREQLLAQGEIVELEIGLWPAGIRFHPGETLQLVIAGHERRVRYLKQEASKTRNAGAHHIHTGGEYDSHLLLPLLPARRGQG